MPDDPVVEQTPPRHYVTYFDFDFIGPATACVPSFLLTQRFDRLTLITPELVGEDPTAVMLAQVVRSLLALDPRLEHLPVEQLMRPAGDVLALLAMAEEAAASPVHVFADTVRAQLPTSFGHPVVWFDADIIFVGDTSSVFDATAGIRTGAAPDAISRLGDQRGLQLYRRFVEHVTQTVPDVALPEEPRNIGFLLLADDMRAAYGDGLRLAVDFLRSETDILARFIVGQLAWNYALARVRAGTLGERFNRPTEELPPAAPEDRLAGATLVRHYIGPIQKKRMILDFALLFAGLDVAATASQAAV